MSFVRPNPNATYEKLFQVAKEARLPYDREAWLNVAFYLSWQYAEWYDKTESIRQIPYPKDPQTKQDVRVPRPVSNKIQHFVLTEHAMALNTRPTVDVLPATDDPINASNAAVLLAYLNWLADENVADFDGALSGAVLWALASTEGFIKTFWDPALENPAGGKGRGDFTVVSPFDLYMDPYAYDFYKARYCIYSRFMDVSQVQDIYGVQVQASEVVENDPNRIALARAMGMGSTLSGARVNELWMRPNRKYPDGMFVVWTGRDTLVPPQPFPYRHKQLPFIQIGSVPRPGSGHYTSAVSVMRPEQMELNNYHAMTIMIQRAFASPKWWVPEELQLQRLPSTDPFQVLRGQGSSGLKPEIIQPGVPPSMEALGGWIRNEMMDSVGVHEVSQAQVPGRVEAAAAIELLKESDNGRLAELTRTIKKGISIAFYQQAMLLKQYGTPQNTFMVYSREGLPETKQLFTTQIDPAVQVRVTMQGGIGMSRAAREDRYMLMWNNGIISDPHVMAELMDVPISMIAPDSAYDIRAQRNENLTMAQGIFVMPHSWDNHEIHLRELNNYRKTPEWDKASPKIKAMMEAHAQFHDQLYIQQLGKELQKQQLAAAVANGAGFQMGAPGPQGEAAPGGQPPSGPGGGPGGPTPTGAPGARPGAPPAATPHAPGPLPIPNGLGAQPPLNPFAARDTVQAQAQYRQRTAANLGHPRTG